MMKKCILLFLIILSIFTITSCKKDGDKEQEEKDLSFIKYEEHFDDIEYYSFASHASQQGQYFRFSPLYQDIDRYFRFSEDYIEESRYSSKILFKKNIIYAIENDSRGYTAYNLPLPRSYDYSEIKDTYLIDNKKVIIEIIEKRNNKYYGYRLFVTYISIEGNYDYLELVESIRFKYDDAFTNLSDEDFELLATKLKNKLVFKEIELNFLNFYNLKVNGKVEKDKLPYFSPYPYSLEIEVPYPELVKIDNTHGVSLYLVKDDEYERFIINNEIDKYYEFFMYSYNRKYDFAYMIDYDFIFPSAMYYPVIPNYILSYMEQIKILKAYEKRYWNDVELKEGRINTFNTLGITDVYYEVFPKLLINDDKCYVTLSNVSKLIDDFEIITPNKTYSNHDFELYYEKYDSKTNEYVTKMNTETMHYLSSIIYYDKINNEAYNLKDAYELGIITENDIEIIIDKLLNYVY